MGQLQLLKKLWAYLADLLEGEDLPDEPVYDPVQVAGVIVGSLAVMGLLFWDLWTLLLFHGGLFIKMGPFLRVVFTAKTLKDFGYEGAPYQMGVFEGWIANLAALVLLLGAVVALWKLYETTGRKEK